MTIGKTRQFQWSCSTLLPHGARAQPAPAEDDVHVCLEQSPAVDELAVLAQLGELCECVRVRVGGWVGKSVSVCANYLSLCGIVRSVGVRGG